ncbi:ATP-binding protein [Streptomyces palmae]|uniref:Helix-turn-helix domain-containing protein n=1 Tax=Streptomyces palmae TaxID=1701085 RepID=A0A4Z0HIY4_9ACTN|nr:tetratricopeptide repeat protein [Streptomyces palmae]TGB19590.1 helix-turn-helix domain-containing protein [Streptomyces palmae]
MTREEPDGFGELLRRLRTGAGFSQEELAHAAGVSVRAVANMERGRTRGPQRRTVQALATALRLPPEQAAELEASAALGRPRRIRAASAENPGPGPVVPGCLPLPRDTRDFTARAPALATLRRLAAPLEYGQAPEHTVAAVAVVSGAPGLGKTAFAVHCAHQLAPRFPDGQFYLDLRGMDPEPIRPADALAQLLSALGVTGGALPPGAEDRSGLFRSLTASRRLLLVLDNAADEEQVRLLLPASGPSLTLLTSRSALAGLEGVHRVALPLLRREEAVKLLSRVVGAERAAREPLAARDLADLCGRLPLALRIAGQRLAARPHESLAKLAAQLRREERRLDTLQAGDLRVRAAFALSYRQLDPTARLVLRRCALAADPGRGVSPETAALLAGVPAGEASRRLDELCDRGLLQSDPVAERFRFHDLLALFAAERLAAEDDLDDREAAVDRTARWMLARATAAALHFDAEQHGTPAGDPDPATAPRGRAHARAWLEAERAQWLAALHHAAAAGRHREVLDAAEAMHWFSDLTQHWEQWVDVFRYAVEAARRLGSVREEATHLNYLAWAYNICAHDHRAALDSARSALAVARACGDRLQTGWALGYGAGALRRLGRTDEAVAWLRESVDCLRESTSSKGRLAEVTALNTLGDTLRGRGDAEEALVHHTRALEICRKGIPGQSTELLAIYRALTDRHLGNDYAALGRWREAEAPMRHALETFDSSHIPAWSGPTRLELGYVLHHLGRIEEAQEAVAGALRTLTAHHHPRQTEAAAELAALETA